MKFWKDPAHIRTLIFYLLAGAAVSGICFYSEPEWGIIVAVICAMFTVFRLVGDMVYESRIRAVCRRAAAALQSKQKPALSDEKRGALYELDGSIYKLAVRLFDVERELDREHTESKRLLRTMSRELILRAEELPANVHRRELVALANDMENLAALEECAVPQEEIKPASAGAVWDEAMILASETLRMKRVVVNAEIAPRAHVTTCPRPLVTGGLRGLLESCARHTDEGAVWSCRVRETAVFTEFCISSDRFDWSGEQLASLFSGDADTEPALIYLSRLASVYNGEARAERVDGQMCHVVFRLYQAVR